MGPPLVRNFIQKNESGTKHFRYFSKRTYDILFHHIYTCLYFYNNECIGYGHLDFENEKIWLGILVSDNFTGLGLGKYILSDLLSQTSEDIFLSVDKDNTTAIRLYTKMGFNILYTTDNYHIM
jgi:GNAT superfamily N-acetyltransferase